MPYPADRGVLGSEGGAKCGDYEANAPRRPGSNGAKWARAIPLRNEGAATRRVMWRTYFTVKLPPCTMSASCRADSRHPRRRRAASAHRFRRENRPLSSSSLGGFFFSHGRPLRPLQARPLAAAVSRSAARHRTPAAWHKLWSPGPSRREAYALLLSPAAIRVGLPMPAAAEFELGIRRPRTTSSRSSRRGLPPSAVAVRRGKRSRSGRLSEGTLTARVTGVSSPSCQVCPRVRSSPLEENVEVLILTFPRDSPTGRVALALRSAAPRGRANMRRLGSPVGAMSRKVRVCFTVAS